MEAKFEKLDDIVASAWQWHQKRYAVDAK